MPRNPSNTIDRGPKIPRVLVRPYIKEYLDRRDMGEMYARSYQSASSSEIINKSLGRKFSKSHALEFESGVNARRIWEVLNVEGYMFFATADKLFCGMNMPDVWYTDPELNAYYTGEKVAA